MVVSTGLVLIYQSSIRLLNQYTLFSSSCKKYFVVYWFNTQIYLATLYLTALTISSSNNFLFNWSSLLISLILYQKFTLLLWIDTASDLIHCYSIHDILDQCTLQYQLNSVICYHITLLPQIILSLLCAKMKINVYYTIFSIDLSIIL